MRQGPEFLQDQEGVLVYIAKRLREALALEELLTASGIDYVVETDQYVGGFIFRTVRVGAFFYVKPDSVKMATEVLRRNAYRPYEPMD
jgi:hypothetical protein